MIYVFIKNNEKIFRLKRCAKFSTGQRVIINGKANLFLIGNRVVLVKEKITSFILSQNNVTVALE
jgi:hypothetical protein